MQVEKSGALVWAAGAKLPLPTAFLDRLTSRDGRSVAEKVLIECTLNLTTGAGVTLLGPDYAGFVKTLGIYDAAGPRVYLRGAHLRAQAHLELTNKMTADPATFAASQTANATFYHTVNFRQPFARRGWDFALPIDDLLDGGKFEIECPASTDLQWTGGIGTINSGTYTIYVYYRDEFDTEFHVRDVRSFQTQSDNQSLVVPAQGALVRSAFAFKDAAGGGIATTTITDVTMIPYRVVAASRGALKTAYLQRNAVLTGQDPFFNDKAFAFTWPRSDAKMSDYFVFGGNLELRLTSTMATPDVVYHLVTPKDFRMMRNAAIRNGVSGKMTRVKTDGKTAGDIKGWGALGPFMSLKSPTGV